MPLYHFDERIERRASKATKWTHYADDVLPMWVADMDFPAPPAVIDALHRRVDHGVFGYQFGDPELSEVLTERLKKRHGMADAAPEQIVYMPGLVFGLNLACRAFGSAGDGVLMQPPIYPPFLSAPGNGGKVAQFAPLAYTREGQRLRYEMDFDALEAALTPQTKLFLLCNPHNPVGRAYTRAELERLAEFVLRHDLILVSDEIHADLTYGQHVSIASFSPEIADRTVTLLAPSKAFNLPGLGCGFAVVSNADLRALLQKTAFATGGFVNALGYTAALAAYRDSGDWLDAALHYLAANRDTLVEYVEDILPEVAVTVPEATYLAWLDLRATCAAGDPYRHCLDTVKLALNDGKEFGMGGRGFVRMNFGCPRSVLLEGLERLRAALALPVA